MLEFSVETFWSIQDFRITSKSCIKVNITFSWFPRLWIFPQKFFSHHSFMRSFHDQCQSLPLSLLLTFSPSVTHFLSFFISLPFPGYSNHTPHIVTFSFLSTDWEWNWMNELNEWIKLIIYWILSWVHTTGIFASFKFSEVECYTYIILYIILVTWYWLFFGGKLFYYHSFLPFQLLSLSFFSLDFYEVFDRILSIPSGM